MLAREAAYEEELKASHRALHCTRLRSFRRDIVRHTTALLSRFRKTVEPKEAQISPPGTLGRKGALGYALGIIPFSTLGDIERAVRVTQSGGSQTTTAFATGQARNAAGDCFPARNVGLFLEAVQRPYRKTTGIPEVTPPHHQELSRNHVKLNARQWARTRRAAFQRDGYRCRTCGRPGALEAHHEPPLRDGPDPYDLDGVRTLCRGCHIELHRPGRHRCGPAGLACLPESDHLGSMLYLMVRAFGFVGRSRANA